MSRHVEPAVQRGIDWLVAAQSATGEFPSYASALVDEPDWAPDRLNFVTALTSLALASVDRPEIAPMRSQVATYLRGEQEAAGLWRYWARESELHDYTPRDADDTACCSMAVRAPVDASNVGLLLTNRDPAGRFYTWFLLRSEHGSLRYRWTLRAERSAAVRARRAELWANSEASPDDVDVTVNANVIRYLGPGRAPVEAVEWVAAVIEEGAEITNDHWYRSRTSLYRSVALAAVAGVDRFAGLRELMIERIASDPGPAGLRNDLERADALRVLRVLRAPPEVVRAHADDLLDRQTAAGCWERALCYFGGPQESFGWASEALATATAIGALDGLAAG